LLRLLLPLNDKV